MSEVDITRHVPACNDLCVECVLWRKVDSILESYELKVEDFARETLARSAAEHQRDEAERWKQYWYREFCRTVDPVHFAHHCMSECAKNLLCPVIANYDAREAHHPDMTSDLAGNRWCVCGKSWPCPDDLRENNAHLRSALVKAEAGYATWRQRAEEAEEVVGALIADRDEWRRTSDAQQVNYQVLRRALAGVFEECDSSNNGWRHGDDSTIKVYIGGDNLRALRAALAALSDNRPEPEGTEP